MKVEIFMQCPACHSEGRNSGSEYWRHGSDGGLTSFMFKPCNGVLCLDEKANVICSKCGKSRRLVDVKLSCSSGRHKFAVASNISYASVISTAAQFSEKGGLSYLMSIMEQL